MLKNLDIFGSSDKKNPDEEYKVSLKEKLRKENLPRFCEELSSPGDGIALIECIRDENIIACKQLKEKLKQFLEQAAERKKEYEKLVSETGYRLPLPYAGTFNDDPSVHEYYAYWAPILEENLKKLETFDYEKNEFWKEIVVSKGFFGKEKRKYGKDYYTILGMLLRCRKEILSSKNETPKTYCDVVKESFVELVRLEVYEKNLDEWIAHLNS